MMTSFASRSCHTNPERSSVKGTSPLSASKAKPESVRMLKSGTPFHRGSRAHRQEPGLLSEWGCLCSWGFVLVVVVFFKQSWEIICQKTPPIYKPTAMSQVKETLIHPRLSTSVEHFVIPRRTEVEEWTNITSVEEMFLGGNLIYILS